MHCAVKANPKDHKTCVFSMLTGRRASLFQVTPGPDEPFFRPPAALLGGGGLTHNTHFASWDGASAQREADDPAIPSTPRGVHVCALPPEGFWSRAVCCWGTVPTFRHALQDQGPRIGGSSCPFTPNPGPGFPPATGEVGCRRRNACHGPARMRGAQGTYPGHDPTTEECRLPVVRRIGGGVWW